MTSTNILVEHVEHDSNGNIIITIKLVIAAAAGVPISNALTVAERNGIERSENQSEDGLAPDNGTTSSSSSEEEDDAAPSTANARYSLRSRVNVEDDGSDGDEHDEYEVDYALSQQVSNFRLYD